jgi:hypothetical protein
MVVAISPNQDIKSGEVKGLANVANASAVLTPNTGYQTLVAAPTTGCKRVNQIMMKNIDASVGADFFIKIVRSATDYTVIKIYLAAGEKLLLEFPFILSTTTSIEAKVSASCTARFIASWVVFPGGMGLTTFTGTSWADVLTVPTAEAYSLLGMVITNTDTSTQTISVQVIDGSSNVIHSDSRLMGPGSNWVSGFNLVLSAGYKVQVKHGAASKTGAAAVSYLPVPA